MGMTRRKCYSTGCFCQWIRHQIYTINLVLGELPKSAVAEGAVYEGIPGSDIPGVEQIGHFFQYVRSMERTRADINAGSARALATNTESVAYRGVRRAE